MSKSPARHSDARQRILETATRLFYAEGIRSVGIDRIIAEARVAKMTLYNHFASKDDLILAVLQHREEQVDAMFAQRMDHHRETAGSQLEAYFAALRDWFESREFRGCSFINAAVELADANHPGSRFAADHKRRMHRRIADWAIEAAGESAAAVAPAITLLVEGAIVTATLENSSQPAETARQAALALLAENS